MQVSRDKWYATKMLSALLVIVLLMIFILNQSFTSKRILTIEPIEDPYIIEFHPPISINIEKQVETIIKKQTQPKPTIEIKVVHSEPIEKAPVEVPDVVVDKPSIENNENNELIDSGELTAALPKMDIVVEEKTKPEPILPWSEKMPEYPGGEKALFEFLRKQVNYPSYEQEIGLEGMVIVSFVVGIDGSIQQIEVLKSPSSGFTKEAKSVINKMSNWTPGMHNGKTVAVRFQLPIKFRIG